jgi:hypothetical protein
VSVSPRLRAVLVIGLATTTLVGCTRGGAAPADSPPTATAGPAAPGQPPTSARLPGLTSTPAPTAAALPERYDPARNATADIAAARALASADHREILLDFGADWCPDCVVLHRLFRSPAVQPVLRQHYHLVAIYVGEFDHNLEVAGRYVDLNSSGIPALAVLTAAGQVRATTNDGSFANARGMTTAQVRAFLTRWAR